MIEKNISFSGRMEDSMEDLYTHMELSNKHIQRKKKKKNARRMYFISI